MTPERKRLLEEHLSLPYEEAQYKSNRVTLNYIKTGSGPNLFLLHGANIGWIEWYPNIQELALNYTVYAFDLPGSGESSELHYEESNFETDYLKPFSDFITHKLKGDIHGIIAHSFGGWLALRLSKEHSYKKLILTNPLGFTRRVPLQHFPLSSTKFARLLSKTAMKPTKKNMKEFTQSVCYNKEVNPQFLDAFCSTISEKRHPFLLISSLMKNFRVKKEIAIKQHECNTALETLIVHGTQDFLIKEKDLHAAKNILSNLTITSFEQSGHVPSLEESDKFNYLSLDFLS
jgi:pimeloyl-ACP methyl ester carboxylesterase